jgi:thioesterase domain-containing protein
MTPAELTSYLHQHIPLSSAMGVRVVECGLRRVVLEAQFAPNVNHQGTVFGGSIAAVAVLSGWCLCRIRFRGPGTQLVVSEETVRYVKPLTGTFRATCEGEDAMFEVALSQFHRRGKARVRLLATVEDVDGVGAELSGEFVALNRV